MFEIYTDGACGKDGRGGWAFIAVEDEVNVVAKASGVKLGTTSQRMELQAAIMALLWCQQFEIKEPMIVSDSAYLVNCFNDEWWKNWACCGVEGGKRVKNEDLWEELFLLAFNRYADFRHIDGHSGDYFNEMADDLAVEAKSFMKMPS